MTGELLPDQGVSVDPVRQDAYLKGLAAGRSERAAEVERLRAGISWARGLCTDEAPYVEIDAGLGRALDEARPSSDEQRLPGVSPAANSPQTREEDTLSDQAGAVHGPGRRGT